MNLATPPEIHLDMLKKLPLRPASLLPPACYFVLPVSAMLDSMGRLMEKLEERHRREEMPATVNVVTGPSRTADNELSLTVGVHGPGEVYVVLVG